MSILYKLFLIIIVTSLTSCASSKIRHEFNNDMLKNKKIYFTINDNSNEVIITKEGPAIGRVIQPNISDIFKNSVEVLSKETNLDTRFSYSYNQVDDSTIHVEATILEIKWKFTQSSATMTSYINYKVVGNDKEYKLIGVFTNMWGGEENYNLTRSFKNANFKLLRELDKTDSQKQTIY